MPPHAAGLRLQRPLVRYLTGILVLPLAVGACDLDRALAPDAAESALPSGQAAATAGVTPSVKPVHSATSRVSWMPSPWKRRARNGITSVKPVKPTNDATMSAAWLRRQSCTAVPEA